MCLKVYYQVEDHAPGYTAGMKDLLLDQYTKQVEKTLFLFMCSHLEQNLLDNENAQSLAHQFLELLPAKNQETFLLNLFILGRQFRQALYTYATYGGKYEEEKRRYLLTHMRTSLASDNIDQALTYSKGGDYHGIN